MMDDQNGRVNGNDSYTGGQPLGTSGMNAGSTGNGAANQTDGPTAQGNGYSAQGTGNGQAQNGGAQNGQGQNFGGRAQGTGYGNYTYNNPYSNAYGSNQTYGSNGSGFGGGNNKKPHKKHTGAKIAGIVAAVAAAACVGVAVGANVTGFGKNTAAASAEAAATLKGVESSASDSTESSKTASSAAEQLTLQTSTKSTVEDEDTVTDVSGMVEEVMPEIVSVYNSYTEDVNFFGETYQQQEEGAGSGIIISKTDSEILIATNNHVVANADELKVQFIDEKTAKAQIKGTDEDNDLAVIAVNLDDVEDSTLDAIKVATIGDSDALKLGEPAIAIGNALNYGQSVTTGVISALNREITDDDGNTNTFIQTDAAINPGNSGGALLNTKGEVIGICSSKIAATQVEGMNFAIPMARAIPIIEDLMNQETRNKVDEDEQGYLGISGVSVTSQISEAYGMPEGVYVAEIIDGGGAADSDLEKGDIITKIDDSKISSMDDLKSQLAYYKAGETITLTVQRGEGGGKYEEKEISLTLGDKSTVESAEKNSSESGSTSGRSSRDGSDGTENGSGDNQNNQGTDPFDYFFGGGY